MDKKNFDMSEAERNRICTEILTDDTHWDLMTGSLLRERLRAYTEDTKNTAKFISAMNCLRLTELTYLYSGNGDKISMPTIPAPEGTVLMVFTDSKRITQKNLKQFKTKGALLSDILGCFPSDDIKSVVINPCDDVFAFPVELITQVFDRLEDIIRNMDSEKSKGIVADNLTEIIFERFGGCTVECDTYDGRHIVGDAYAYDENDKGPYLTISVSDTEKVDVYKSEVKFIKDVTDYEAS